MKINLLDTLKLKENILLNTYNLINNDTKIDRDLKALTFEIDSFKKYSCDEYLDLESYNNHLEVCIKKLFKEYLEKNK